MAVRRERGCYLWVEDQHCHVVVEGGGVGAAGAVVAVEGLELHTSTHDAVACPREVALAAVAGGGQEVEHEGGEDGDDHDLHACTSEGIGQFR